MTVKEVITTSARGDGEFTGVTRPTLTVYRPSGAFTTAILVVPGGGFSKVVVDKEGHEIARWLAKNGIAAGVLSYRLPSDVWPQHSNILLQDAQRGIRLLRQQTAAARTGVMGFSAGGTIAETLDARAGEVSYRAVDGADKLAAKPDFVALVYPYLGIPKRPVDHGFKGFPKAPAPTFLVHAAPDERAPAENSREAYKAIIKAGGKAELHVFPTGEHGFALRSPPGAPTAAWPDLFLDWLKRL